MEIFVSPSGDDRNPGTAGAPLATLEEARDRIRPHLADMSENIVVTLKGGRHRIDAPVKLDPRDGGRNGFHVVYRAAPGEDVFLDAGRVVREWSPHEKGMVKASIGTEPLFRGIFVNGAYRGMAAHPNGKRTYQWNKTYKQSEGLIGVEAGPEDLIADLPSPASNPVEARSRLGAQFWRYNIIQLKSLETVEDGVLLHLTDLCASTAKWSDFILGAFKFYNAYAFVDEGGEWYHDREEGVLYYMPMENEHPETLEVVVPAAESVFHLTGSEETPVRHIRFQNLHFRHVNETRASRGGVFVGLGSMLYPTEETYRKDKRYHANYKRDRLKGAISMRHVGDIGIDGCSFVNCTGAGILAHGRVDTLRIRRNYFARICGAAIDIGEAIVEPDHPEWWPAKNLLVHDNHIEHTGMQYKGCTGIFTALIADSTLSHNNVLHSSYQGIYFGWGWMSDPEKRTLANAGNNRILNNKVHHSMTGPVSDGGGVMPLGKMPGTVLEGNYVAFGTGYGAFYTDGETEDLLITNNVTHTGDGPWMKTSSGSKRVRFVDNYATTDRDTNKGAKNGCVVIDLTVVPDADWPPEARALIRAAGTTTDIPLPPDRR